MKRGKSKTSLKNSNTLKMLLGVFALIFACVVFVYAALLPGGKAYQINPNQSQLINNWSICKNVTNNGSLPIFVPVNTSGEWSNFISNKPSYVGMKDCVLCGNGICDPLETQYNCPQDCPYCGDGICDPSLLENEYSCSEDCGPKCGDGWCNGEETCETCDDCACGYGYLCESGSCLERKCWSDSECSPCHQCQPSVGCVSVCVGYEVCIEGGCYEPGSAEYCRAYPITYWCI